MDGMTFANGRPAIGIIALGTGNELARFHNRGRKFRDKPLRKVIIDIAKADVVDLDRWLLTVTPVDEAPGNFRTFSGSVYGPDFPEVRN